MYCIVCLFPSLSAYDEKQRSKRQQISSRSWFSSTSATAGGAAGSLLHKLGLQGKEAAAAKALSSSHSPLIRKRMSTGARRESVPEGNVCKLSNISPRWDVTQTGDGGCMDSKSSNNSETKGDRSLTGITSLVADYSDSDSDPGQ